MMRNLLLLLILSLAPVASLGDIDSFELLSDDQAKEFGESVGVKADYWWMHVDFEREDSAPVIQMSLYGPNKEPKSVGSFSAFKDVLRGMGEVESLLQIQYWLTYENNSDAILALRPVSFELLDEEKVVMIASHYMDSAGDIFMQLMVLYWSYDEKYKCVLASDIEQRLSAHYEDTTTDALVQLLEYCQFQMQSHES